MQVIVAGLLFLYMLPAVLFGWFRGEGWAPLLAMNGWVRQLGMQLVVVLALPGVSAVMEFAERGEAHRFLMMRRRIWYGVECIGMLRIRCRCLVRW